MSSYSVSGPIVRNLGPNLASIRITLLLSDPKRYDFRRWRTIVIRHDGVTEIRNWVSFGSVTYSERWLYYGLKKALPEGRS